MPASDPDPDKIFVLQQDTAVGQIALEVKEAHSNLHMPSRLYFS